MIKPMLATKYKEGILGNLDEWEVQAKIDGHRCLVHYVPGKKAVAYSRTGHVINIPEITNVCERLGNNHEVIFDGELFSKGTGATGFTKILNRNPELVRYCIFDIFVPSRPELTYRQRFSMEYYGVCSFRQVITINSGNDWWINDMPFDIDEILKHYLQQGFEGAMFRNLNAPYKQGRSKDLIKLKPYNDIEVKVIDMRMGKKGRPLCIYEYNGHYGSVVAPGSLEEKQHALDTFKEPRLLTVSYAYKTDDNRLFHPVAVRWREDL